MDEAGIDKACMLRESFLNMSYNAVPCSTNYHTLEAMQKYPDRIIGCSNVGPHLIRGKKLLRNWRSLTRNTDSSARKSTSPKDSGPFNHPDMFPFYEKCVEWGAVVFIHTGFAVGGHSEYCGPMLLDNICLAFPELKIVAYHFGWPDNDTLNALAWKHRNLYIGMSGILGPMYYAPVKLAHMVGSIMNILLGSERIVFGTDWPAAPADLSVKAVVNLQIPTDLQEGWGYPPITAQDKANMLGLNLAKLLKVEVPKKYQSVANLQASAL